MKKAKKITASARAKQLNKDGLKPAQILETLTKEGYKSRFGKPLKMANIYGFNHANNPKKSHGLKRSKNPDVSAQLDAIDAIAGVSSIEGEQRLAIIRKIVS